jgi:hypothetical protein
VQTLEHGHPQYTTVMRQEVRETNPGKQKEELNYVSL